MTKVSGRILIVIFILLLAAVSFPHACRAITTAGTSIESYAEIRVAGRRYFSNITTQEVIQIYGLDLDPLSSEASISPGQTYYFPHVLTNVGNGSDLVTFSIVEVTPAAWSATLIRDVNMNGSFEGGTDVVIGMSTQEPRSEESAYYLLLALTAPATGEIIGSATLRITSEADDGGFYFGANGVLYGGDDAIGIVDRASAALTNFGIIRDDATGDIILTWEGSSADIYFLTGFSTDFASASLEASGATSPYTSTAISAQDGNTRYYRVANVGTRIYASGTAGKFDIPVSVGINELSLPVVPYSDLISDVIGTQVVGASNAFNADRIWKYNPSAQSGYDYAWLVGGVGPPFDGQWYTGNNPTTLTLGPDEGFVLQIRAGHPATYITIAGMVSEADRSIPIGIGLNFVGTCFPVDVPLGDQASSGDSNLWESGATGASNAFNADRVWKYNPSAQSGYDYAWLVDNVNPTYDGKWYSGNNPTTMKLEPGLGYWMQVRDNHSPFTWDYEKPY